MSNLHTPEVIQELQFLIRTIDQDMKTVNGVGLYAQGYRDALTAIRRDLQYRLTGQVGQ